MSQNKVVVSEHNTEYGNLKTYTIGFVLSLIFTISSYLLVVNRGRARVTLIAGVIITLALTQFIVQLLYFLHLGKETKPRWKLYVFIMMIVIVLILVFGSIWIMNNLNYRMTPEQINNYMNSQGGGF
jgi:cytochrome o ubiquinol oxidase operon protein cyoD